MSENRLDLSNDSPLNTLDIAAGFAYRSRRSGRAAATLAGGAEGAGPEGTSQARPLPAERILEIQQRRREAPTSFRKETSFR